MRDHFIMFARYNGWANKELYHAAAELSEAEYNRDCDVAFTSMNGTLNHLLLVDELWMNRYRETNKGPAALDIILHATFDELLEARRAMDDQIIAFCEGLDDAALAGTYTYSPLESSERITLELAPSLAHFFNHHTHHRGQAHAMLTRLRGEAPSLDLHFYQLDLRSGKAA